MAVDSVAWEIQKGLGAVPGKNRVWGDDGPQQGCDVSLGLLFFLDSMVSSPPKRALPPMEWSSVAGRSVGILGGLRPLHKTSTLDEQVLERPGLQPSWTEQIIVLSLLIVTLHLNPAAVPLSSRPLLSGITLVGTAVLVLLLSQDPSGFLNSEMSPPRPPNLSS